MPSRLIYSKVRSPRDKKRYLYNLKYPNIPLSIDDIYITTTSEDRLDLLAKDFYKDPDLWWIISNANPNKIRRDSLRLEGNIEIRIPSNVQQILRDFERENLKTNY